MIIVGTMVFLDGSASLDPEGDLLGYSWTIASAPTGSMAILDGADTAFPQLVPDFVGLYEVTLVASDFIGPGSPDSVQITAITADDFAEAKIQAAATAVAALALEQVTTQGNQQAFLNFLSQAVLAIQANDPAAAIDKLTKAIERADGCVLRGSPDGNGPGRDWITDCTAQIEIYTLLSDALDALTL